MGRKYSMAEKAALAISDKIGDWLSGEKGRSMQTLQSLFFDETGLITQLSQIKSTAHSASEKKYQEVRDFLNNKLTGLPEIDENWNYGTAAPDHVFYILYYATNDLVKKSVVEVEVQNSRWTSFHLTHYRRSGDRLVPSSNYSGDASAITYSAEGVFCLLTNSSGQAGSYSKPRHAYTFSGQQTFITSQRYVFGTYSRRKSETGTPVAGVCLLARCDAPNLAAVEASLAEPVPQSIYNILYGRRVELRENETRPNINHLPNAEALQHLADYSGTWEARHLDSELHDQKGYLRTFQMKLESNGHAVLSYSDHDPVERIEHVEGFFTCLDATLFYGEFQWDRVNFISRLIFCLTPGDPNTMTGVYGGYSSRNRKPYAGAVTMVRTDTPHIANISRENQSISELPLVLSVQKAYTKHLNLPEHSLDQRLQAHFNNRQEDLSDIIGDYVAYSLSSSKQSIVAYPLSFQNGICTLTGKTHRFYAPVERDAGSFVWLEFDTRAYHVRPWKSILAISYRGRNFSHFEYLSGVSLRENSEGKLQAKRELIVKEKGTGSLQFQSYPFGSAAFEQLLQRLPGLKSFLGREYSVMEIVKSANVKDLAKRSEFDEMYLLQAVRCFLENRDNDWQEYLKQATLHGLTFVKPIHEHLKDLAKTFPIPDLDRMVTAFEHTVAEVEAGWTAAKKDT